MFNRLEQLNDLFDEVEPVKPEIEHKKPIIAGFFYPKVRYVGKLELYYKFFQTFSHFCDSDNYEELEMDTN